MAISLSNLRSTTRSTPPIAIFYGVDGVGKTQLASEFPNPVLLATEGERPPIDVELPTFGTIGSLADVFDAVGALLTEEHGYKTLIVDSLDGLEPLIWRETSARLKVESIEDAGYGKGYVEADKEWREYLSAITALTRKGIAVVQLAHPEIVRFDSPTSDPYSRYGIKLHKRAGALVRETADLVGFLNYRVTLKEKDVGFKKTVTHGVGGSDRQIHLEERAGFCAKNRYSMPESIPYRNT